FKSRIIEKFFAFLTPLLYPLTVKSIPFCAKFFSEDCIESMRAARPDIIIASGSSTIPVALLLSKIYRAKKIALMSPPFPFSFFNFDLVIAPKHDGSLKGRNVLNTTLALSAFDSEIIKKESSDLKMRLAQPERLAIGLLIGGSSKNYIFNRRNMDLALDKIDWACKKLNVDFIATTCRRTDPDYEKKLEEKVKKLSSCQQLILSDKEAATNLVSAMIGLCKIMIATEESISMISEPINAGKKVLILKLNKKICPKYARFHNLLIKNGLAHISDFNNLAEKIIEIYKNTTYDLSESEKEILKTERQALKERLAGLL
ncbi:MAG: mitochondrial fission ELM1 family protein, partial [Candidatus Omnitrophica bacterium]|nr:mitochondrial fission ELM1 family protein [Candidatus Omnitrophota bacterium]